jgi:hypothetical protein
MTAPQSMITIFINLLAAAAPSLWVILAGVLGVGIGAYGKMKFDLRKETQLPRRKVVPRKTLPIKRPRK